MPLPSNSELATLDIAYLGAPFVQVEAKTLGTTSLDIAYLGAPFVAVGPTAAPPVSGLNTYVRVAGVWKQATALYVRVGGAWKTATTISARVGGVWET
jgi:hypothetical protein